MTTPADIFAKIPQNFDPEKAKGINMVLAFKLSGDNGGDWNINIADGKIDVNEGAAEDPAATVSMDGDDYVKMMSGDLNPMMAFMSGKIKVDGDLNSVMKMQSIFGM
jgi:putative sterol carrier protein